MSALERWTLTRDADRRCGSRFEGHPGEAREDVRTTAAGEGWKVARLHGNGFDFCPGCWEKPPPPPPRRTRRTEVPETPKPKPKAPKPQAPKPRREFPRFERTEAHDGDADD